jgi:hypothetical protein
MRAVPPYAPRRPGRAVLALAVFGATSGLIACEGKVGVNPMGAGGNGAVTGTAGAGAGTGTGGAGSGTAGSGSGGSATGGTGATPVPTTPAAFGTCPSGGGEPGATPLAKLSTFQYRNTVRDLLNASGLSAVTTEVAPMLAAIPDDSTLAFRGLDARISSDHIRATSTSPPRSPTRDNSSSRLTSLAGSCAGVAAGGQLPGRLPRSFGKAPFAAAGHDRARADEDIATGTSRLPPPTPPRRFATWS